MLSMELEGEKIDLGEFAALHPELEIVCQPEAENRMRITCKVPAAMDIRQDLAKFVSNRGWLILEMHQQQQSLEKIFHELTGDDMLEEDIPGAAEAPESDMVIDGQPEGEEQP